MATWPNSSDNFLQGELRLGEGHLDSGVLTPDVARLKYRPAELGRGECRRKWRGGGTLWDEGCRDSLCDPPPITAIEGVAIPLSDSSSGRGRGRVDEAMGVG